MWSTWLASKIATFTQHSIDKMSISSVLLCLRSLEKFRNSILTVVLVVGVVVDVVGVVVDVVGVVVDVVGV